MFERLTDQITSENDLRAHIGMPARLSVAKSLTRLDGHCRDFIARSPFVVIGSGDGQGHFDVSPKGDPPGFVQVLDDITLAIPDRPGNRRADTLGNILLQPSVGLLFLVPGSGDTLRVNGRAALVRDTWLLDRMKVRGRAPSLAIAVEVEEAFFHCAKCVIRSGLWEANDWQPVDGLAPLAKILADQTQLDTEAQMQQAVDESYRDRLY